MNAQEPEGPFHGSASIRMILLATVSAKSLSSLRQHLWYCFQCRLGRSPLPFLPLIGLLGTGSGCNQLVRSCEHLITFPLAIDHPNASSLRTALKVGLPLFFLGAFVRLDPASRQLAILFSLFDGRRATCGFAFL